MATVRDTLTKFEADTNTFIALFKDKVSVKPIHCWDYVRIFEIYTCVHSLRLKTEKIVSKLKSVENKIKEAATLKLLGDKLETTKTTLGSFVLIESKSIVIKDRAAFLAWFKNHLDDMTDALPSKLYTQKGIKELIDEDSYPPGLGDYKELKLNIRKNR